MLFTIIIKVCDSIDSFDSLTICPYRPLILISPQDGTHCLHWASCPTLFCPDVEVHWSTSPMSLSFTSSTHHVLQVFDVYEVRGKWLYNWCFIGGYFQDLFKTACMILVGFLSLESKWYNHTIVMEEFLFYFIRDIRFSYGC